MRFFKIFFLLFFSSYLFSQSINVHQLEKKAARWLNVSSLSLKKVNGGLTNVSFIGTSKKGKYIVRVGKDDPEALGIDRPCEIACQKAASRVGIAPKIFYKDLHNGILISQFLDGKTLSASDVYDSQKLKQIIETVKTCHAISFKKVLKTVSVWDNVRNMLVRSGQGDSSFLSQEQVEHIQEVIDRIENYFQGKEKGYEGLCHNDLVAENFIDNGKQLFLIDWEYACWGNILFDLASLCVEQGFDQEKKKEVLKLYFGDTWEQHECAFKLMCVIFNLRDALWYNLRGKELVAIRSVNMNHFAQKYLDLFWLGVQEFFDDEKTETSCFVC